MCENPKWVRLQTRLNISEALGTSQDGEWEEKLGHLAW